MWTKKFWVPTAERAIKTFAQTLLAVTGLAAATTMTDIPWEAGVYAALLAALASVLTSIGSYPFGPEGTPSVVGAAPALHEGDADLREKIDKLDAHVTRVDSGLRHVRSDLKQHIHDSSQTEMTRGCDFGWIVHSESLDQNIKFFDMKVDASLSDDRTMRTYPGVSTSPDVGYRESSLLQS